LLRGRDSGSCGVLAEDSQLRQVLRKLVVRPLTEMLEVRILVSIKKSVNIEIDAFTECDR
jgi:hypothetical protein